ncbi:D-alanine--D-alanine ligase [Gluconacetobacter entanii]|uniref:D-alanine--D-alanine ligase n=1 Tax=Gluconacetobacter entanii TaxID=108528 RepID=A0A318PUW7_9PROT|nr:D-alanine--D-alanine ligase [Gluconacetobacter entanii]MCE2577301.1 D-alanine--D-alanine ligase [Komagataeibacter sp. FNDCR1]MBY4638751.1 D-alanine--D-alanine ligase [Gluconacetobacter entanii]MCW4581770.1 D-alanine--D-alanine ligase [Gluconacetobacter entanii]MCW4585112.1 D-alanine--D-alanine ligase [Gluconacetobacter entanii]MCW4588726.1 D-alanine--D-alanine ligase [Gluconacetobacter entanii]
MTRPSISVLMGGMSAEREVSLKSGAGVTEALRSLGYDVRQIIAGEDLGAIVSDLQAHRPDVVFNALHGRFGEDGCIQGVLDWMGISYTHSGVRASAVAMDKAAARTIFAAAGLPVAHGRVVAMAELEAADPLPAPYVIKPLNEGSSVGVQIIRAGANTRASIARSWQFGTSALVEEFIPGRELTVGVMGDRALTVTDITPQESGGNGFYDYAAKYQQGGSSHVLPARIHPDAFERARELALAAHRVLGCRGASRTDFRYDDTRDPDGPGRLVILETNTQPGMTETSLLPEQAAACGVSYPHLCQWLVEQATCRT